jgi:hypothetical protein
VTFRYSERDQKILACCGLWLMREGWDSESNVRVQGEPFSLWLERNSFVHLARQFMARSKKKAHLEP